jgi:hypothetical protein
MLLPIHTTEIRLVTALLTTRYLLPNSDTTKTNVPSLFSGEENEEHHENN